MMPSPEFITLGDGEVSIRDSRTPDAPVVFLFHSLGTSAELWTPQFETLARSYRLIAMDCRGHGRTSCRGAFSIAACVADARAVLDARAVTRAHVVGLSMGGLMAAQLAAQPDAGERVRSVTLACSYATLAGTSSQARLDGTRDALERMSMATFARQYMDSTATSKLDSRWRERMIAVIGAMKAGDYLITLRDILFHDCTAALRALRVPALVLSGALDSRVSAQTTAKLAGEIASARTTRLAQAGHLANIEAPDAFNAALDAFWRSIDA